MQYAVWIALAVVALAIVPPILKNRRERRDAGISGAAPGDSGADGNCTAAASDSCDSGGDGGSD